MTGARIVFCPVGPIDFVAVLWSWEPHIGRASRGRSCAITGIRHVADRAAPTGTANGEEIAAWLNAEPNDQSGAGPNDLSPASATVR
jgi:hypothetical protein